MTIAIDTIDNATIDQHAVEPLDPERMVHHPAMSRWTWALVGLAIAGLGFFAGAKVTKHNADSSGFQLPGGISLPAGFNPSALGGGGFPGLTGSGTATPTTSTGATIGKIVLISGGKVYVEDSSGTKTAVAVASGTEVSIGTTATAGDLQVGDSVLIDGAKDSNGVVAATAIVATKPPTSTVPPASSAGSTPANQ
jgi:hypothetical protein